MKPLKITQDFNVKVPFCILLEVSKNYKLDNKQFPPLKKCESRVRVVGVVGGGPLDYCNTLYITLFWGGRTFEIFKP